MYLTSVFILNTLLDRKKNKKGKKITKMSVYEKQNSLYDTYTNIK